jgi:alanyl-tRNA synthetase
VARKRSRKLGQRVIDEGDLFLEIWNMVFPQYDQQRDGSREFLKNKGIDTGAGLERMTVALTFRAPAAFQRPTRQT